MLNNDFDPPLPRPIVVPAGSGYNSSGVSWGAILAGAAAAAALSLILIFLGLGFGFSVMSPWASEGVGATTLGVSTVIWMILTHSVAFAFGGYIAGRLRVKWADVNTDEIYFRDTAHGMLSWAVATLVTALLLTSVVAGVARSGLEATGNVASSAVSAAGSAAGSMGEEANGDTVSYFVDSLFRSDEFSPTRAEASDVRGEALTVLIHSMKTGTLSEEDKSYVARLVTQETGISQAEAESRLDELYAQAQQAVEQAETQVREAADAARKAAAHLALWTFVSLLCGAFFASLFAIWGGRQRDVAALEHARPNVV